MQISGVRTVLYSPTGTTRRVLDAIATGTGFARLLPLDLTTPSSARSVCLEDSSELALIGGPVYGGYLPSLAAERLSRVKSQGAPAAIVAVYGNRDFGHTLVELDEITRACGFMPVGAAAFIGEHSYSTAQFPIAPGRPDPADIAKAHEFGRLVRGKLDAIQGLTGTQPVILPDGPCGRIAPGNPPMSDPQRCTACGLCVTVCPTGVARFDPGASSDSEDNGCTLCMACVKACPEGARSLCGGSLQRITNAASRLSQRLAGVRKEPEFFL